MAVDRMKELFPGFAQDDFSLVHIVNSCEEMMNVQVPRPPSLLIASQAETVAMVGAKVEMNARQ